MTTIIENRMPASEKINAELQTLLTEMMSEWDAIAKLETHISEVVQLLITDPTATKEIWLGIAERIQWGSLKQETLLDAMIMVQGNPYGHIIIEKILSCDKVVKIEDFRMMLQQLNAVNFHAIAAVTQKLFDNGNYHGDSAWRKLAIEFANKAGSILQKNTEESVWHSIRDNHDWEILPQWLMRIISKYLFDHNHGHLILMEIIPLKILGLEHFVDHVEKIAEAPPQLKWAVRASVLETDCHKGFDHIWERLIGKIFHQAAYPKTYNLYHGISQKWMNSGGAKISNHRKFH